MELYWIRLKLSQWGRMCRAIGIGYPTMASHERARSGRGGAFERALPQDIAEIDVCIARSPPQHKLILVECYTKDAHWREHAARLSLSVDAYYRRKKTAELYLNSQLRTQMEA
jgi:hypothetical protein